MEVGNQQKHFSVSFATKNVNLSLEELKNIKITIFLNTKTVQIAKFQKISHFCNQHDSSRPSCKYRVTSKALKLKRSLSQNQERIRSKNLFEYA